MPDAAGPDPNRMTAGDEPPLNEPPFLEADLETWLGSFHLAARFALRSPWTVLYGPSGAGKSTLLRLLAGLAQPERGSLRLGRETLLDTARRISIAAGQRGIGFAAQRPALFEHMSVAENVGFGLRGLDRAARRQRVEEMLAMFEAEPLAFRRPAGLSGGEQQRVALARALANEPKLLLLDEPFSALDGALKERIFERLAAWLTARAIPALYVSHDLAEVFLTGAEVIAMNEGRVTGQGPVASVLGEERARLLRHLRA